MIPHPLFRITFILLIFCNQIRQAHCQESQLNFRHITTENGLPSSEVYCALQDSKGNMWFGTDRGAARYDGYEFRVFAYKDGLTDNTIFKLQEDSRGRIWMLSFSGRVYYMENEKIVPYTYNNILQQESKNRIPIFFHVDSLENVVVSIHSFGIFKINNKGNLQWICRLNNSGEIKYVIDETFEKKIVLGYKIDLRIANSKLLHSTESSKDTFALSQSATARLSALRTSPENLFLSAGKFLYKLSNHSLEKVADLPATILAISGDQKGNLWIGTQTGAFVFDQKNLKTIPHQLLDDQSISDILQDNEGGFWLTTLNNGIYYMPGYGIDGIPFNSEPVQKPISLASDKQHSIYAGCWNGVLVKITNNKKEIYFSPSDPDFNFMIYNMTYVEKDKKLYLARTKPGYIKEKKFYPLFSKLTYGIKTDFIQAEDNSFYAAGTSFLFKINKNGLVDTTSIGVRINCLARDEQNRIILGCSDGAYIFDPVTKKIKPLHKDLVNLRIDDIKIFGKRIVFATKGKGILILSQNNIETIDESKGLCSNLVNKILIRDHQIWCATNKGISKINFNGGTASNYTIVNIHNSHGLYSDEINSITELNDTIYAASNSGISYFDSNTDFVNSTNPLVQITSLRINNSDTTLSDRLELSHTQNNIHIGFTGISYRSKGEISYQYQLIHESDTLHSKIKGRSVEFLSLSPGNYLFSVSAINNSGLYSKFPATITFCIQPAWWQTLWFKLLLALLFSLVLYVLYRNRLEKYKERFEMERKQASLQLIAIRAQMNPHFIFNVMNSIRNYMQNHDMESAEKYLTSFSKLVRYTLDNSEVQEIPLGEELNALSMYVEHEKLRFENGFDFTINIEKEIDLSETTILSMLLQPIVENSIKHGISKLSSGGKIQIDIKQKKGRLHIAIEDNGIGTSESLKWNSTNEESHVPFGTTINTDRIKAYNKVFNKNITISTINLTTEDGTSSGTRVEVEF